ncbi:MAG: hypothetical protein JHC98_03985 [Thermoleophilaceae bacterium]|nr:hypothetical protein [Thermoleophilaceae bacterium]
MTTARVFVIGGIGIDDVAFLPGEPRVGGFVQASDRTVRIGGSAANVAIGLAESGVKTVLVGSVGSDHYGDELIGTAASAGVEIRVGRAEGPSPVSWVLVDPTGQRTIIGTNDGLLDLIPKHGFQRMQDLRSADVVVFPSWRHDFLPLLSFAAEREAKTIVGLRALQQTEVSADLAIGSEVEFPNEETIVNYLPRFTEIVVTSGAEGATTYLQDAHHHQPGVKVDVIDSTGAGDAFLAAYLRAWIAGVDTDSALTVATTAGSLACERRTSTPPLWERVLERLPAQVREGLVTADESEQGRGHLTLLNTEPLAGPETVELAEAPLERPAPGISRHPRLVDPELVRAAVENRGTVLAAWQYGSSLRADFRPGRSDVDILLVVRNGADPAQFPALVAALRMNIPEVEATILKEEEIRDGHHPGWSRHFFRNVKRTGVHLFGPDLLNDVPATSFEEARRRIVQLAQRARLVVSNANKVDESAFWLSKYQQWIPLCLLELLDLAGFPHEQLRRAHSDFVAHFPMASSPVAYPYPSLEAAHAFLEDLASWLASNSEQFLNNPSPGEIE